MVWENPKLNHPKTTKRIINIINTCTPEPFPAECTVPRTALEETALPREPLKSKPHTSCARTKEQKSRHFSPVSSVTATRIISQCTPRARVCERAYKRARRIYTYVRARGSIFPCLYYVHIYAHHVRLKTTPTTGAISLASSVYG